MAYLNTHPDFPALEELFNKYDYTIDVDLSNELVIQKNDSEDMWDGSEALPKELQRALDAFEATILADENIEMEDALIDIVIEKIKEDINDGDVSAIFELLRFCPVDNLIQYLPEEEWKEFKED